MPKGIRHDNLISANIDNVNKLIRAGYKKVDLVTAKVSNTVKSSILNKKTDAELKELLKKKEEERKKLVAQIKADNKNILVKTIKDGLALSVFLLVPGGSVIATKLNGVEQLKSCVNEINVINAILKERRKTPVKEAFSILRESYNDAGVDSFITKCNSLPGQSILNESKYIFTVNESTSNYFNDFCKLNSKLFSDQELVEKYEEVYEVLNKSIDKNIATGNHFESMVDIKETLEDEIKRRSYNKNCLLESYKTSLEEETLITTRDRKIFDSIKLNPGNIDNDIKRVESLIESFANNFSNANMLITKLIPVSTVIVNNYPDKLTEGSSIVNIGDTLKSLINKNESNIIRYRKILESNIKDICETNTISKIYKDKLEDNMAIFHQAAYNVVYKPEPSAVTESIIINSEAETEILEDLLVESVINIGINEEISESDFKKNLNTFYRCAKELDLLEEAAKINRGSKSKTFKVANKIEKGVRKFTNNARDRYDTNKRNKMGIDKAKEHIEKTINYPIQKFLEKDREDRKKRIIQGGFRAQVWKWLKIAVRSGFIGWAINPLMGAITAIGLAAIDKGTDARTKRDILKELETEIKICEEKIEDSKSEAKKREKYQLMRLKAKLEKEYERIKYNLGAK